MLIGLAGKAGSGKDQTYQYIDKWAGNQCHVRRDAFADRLKWSAARLFFPDIACEDAVAWCNAIKDKEAMITIAVMDPIGVMRAISGREFLQRYGTESHREIFDQDFWIDAVLDNYDPSEIMVITDVRFPNEAEAVKNCGGQMWEIRRPGAEITESEHASEKDLPAELIDHVLINDGSLDDLQKMVVSLMKKAVQI